MENDCCAICLEDLKFNNRKVHTTECNHNFHELCFKKIKADNCPCCRGMILRNKSSLKCEVKFNIRELKSKFKIDKKELGDILLVSKTEIVDFNKKLRIAISELNLLVKSEVILQNPTLLMMQTDKIHVITIKIFRANLKFESDQSNYLKCLDLFKIEYSREENNLFLLEM